MGSQAKRMDRILEEALIYQQNFYELLPDWTVYKKDDIKYLKQNIGYAIFGSPLHEKNSNSDENLTYVTDNIKDDTEISDLVHYGSDAEITINLIVNKICEYGIHEDNTIKFGVIYLIVFDPAQCDKNTDAELIALPVFKILVYDKNNNKSEQKSKGIQNIYSTWYIDIKGRIYEDWNDYIMTNELPECIIIYPKGGFYQPDPKYSITLERSTVWVIAQDSVACSSRAKVVSAINMTANALSTASTIGLGIASAVTPVGPALAATGIAVSCASGLWTIGKCSTELYDKKVHKESISPFNKSALSSWLGIAGSTVGITVSGGSVLLRKAATSGVTVGKVAKTAYNVTLISSISINLIGIVHQGHHIYKKYQEGRIKMEDLVYFGTHLLFFVNNIIDIKFANDIIEATQGKILEEYETNLRNDNLRKHYEYVKEQVAATEVDKIGQSAAIIRYMNKFDIKNTPEAQPVINYSQSSSNILMVQQYKLQYNGIMLIDPIRFVTDFAKSYVRGNNTPRNDKNSQSVDNSEMLLKVLDQLLSNLYMSSDCPSHEQLLLIPDFKVIIDELKKINHSEDILPAVFNIALTLVRAKNMYAYLVEACRFVWDYIKKNMYEAGFIIDSNYEKENYSGQYMLSLFTALFHAVDNAINRFLNALHQYLYLRK